MCIEHELEVFGGVAVFPPHTTHFTQFIKSDGLSCMRVHGWVAWELAANSGSP